MDALVAAPLRPHPLHCRQQPRHRRHDGHILQCRRCDDEPGAREGSKYDCSVLVIVRGIGRTEQGVLRNLTGAVRKHHQRVGPRRQRGADDDVVLGRVIDADAERRVVADDGVLDAEVTAGDVIRLMR